MITKIKIFKVSPDVKRALKDKLMSVKSTKIFLEHFAIELQQTISIEELMNQERDNLNRVIKLLKSISALKSENYLLDNIRISVENSSYTDEDKGVIIIPRDCLKSIESCSSKLINALASVRYGANQFKDYIIGELCSACLELRNTNLY